MSIYFLILTFVLCSGEVFALLREEGNPYTYDVFMKESHLYNEYYRFLNKKYSRHGLEIVGLDYLAPDDIQRLAILLDKLLLVELSLILAAFSIHSVEMPEEDLQSNLDYTKVIGCVNFMDHLLWYNELVIPIDTLINESKQNDGAANEGGNSEKDEFKRNDGAANEGGDTEKDESKQNDGAANEGGDTVKDESKRNYGAANPGGDTVKDESKRNYGAANEGGDTVKDESKRNDGAANEGGDTVKGSYFSDMAKLIQVLLNDAKKLTEVVINHKYDFSNIFEALHQANSQNLDVNEMARIVLPEKQGRKKKEAHYKEVFGRLVKYFGQNLLTAKNFFRSVFMEKPINSKDTVFMSLEDVHAFLDKVRFIRWGLVLSKDYLNIGATAIVQTDLLELLKPVRVFRPPLENSPWTIRYEGSEKRIPEFVFWPK